MTGSQGSRTTPPPPSAAGFLAGRFARADAAHPAVAEIRRLAAQRGVSEDFHSEAGPPRAGDIPAQGQDAGCPTCGLHPEHRLDPLEMLAADPRLPALPQVAMRLIQLAEDPATSLHDLARVISLDAWLSAYVLRIVNSALYSLPAKVDTISRAVAILGGRRLATLAMGASVLRGFASAKAGPLDMQRFWRHSLACAILAQSMARRLGLNPPERFFVAGLLHDVGRLALFALQPQAAAAALERCRRGGLLLAEAEEQALGFDHARMGAMLLRKWNFPMPLARAVLLHADPGPAGEGAVDPLAVVGSEALVVHVADIMAKGLGHGATPFAGVPPLWPGAWKLLGLQVETLAELAAELDGCLADTAAMLGVGPRRA